MTFTAAAASGGEAVDDLERLLAPRRARGEVCWAAHRGHAVAWTTRHRWVSSADDGDVLVVLDGHGRVTPGQGAALDVGRGDVVLVPWCAGDWRVDGDVTAVLCRPPAPDAPEAPR